MSRILGISAYYHDSAAALLIDGEIIAAAQEERFNRLKHTAVFPLQAIQYCLEEAKLEMDDIDIVVFYDKPFLKFERLLESYKALAPKGWLSFAMAMPSWIKEKLFLKKQLYKGLKKVGLSKKNNVQLLFSEHHLSHAASAFYASPFKEAAILTIDGVGEWATASISHGTTNGIKLIKEMHFPHSVGLLYSAFTYYLGFKVNSGEYKLMGLAPYGNPNSDSVNAFKMKIKEHLIDIKEDGSIWMDQAYFRYATGLKMTHNQRWKTLFGFGPRKVEERLEQHHCDLALAIQEITEEIVLKMATEAQRLTASKNICLAGGVALNGIANHHLKKSGLFQCQWIQPAAGDAGGALGAAYSVYYNYEQNSRSHFKDEMQGAYLGPSYSPQLIQEMIAENKAEATEVSREELIEKVTEELGNGKIVGWFQGRMEFGPRALGNRSILADPTQPEMQKRLNLAVKKRESFRPFAPLIRQEDANEYFEVESSPYMLEIGPLKEKWRKELPENYYELDLMSRLKVERSLFQAITHLDFSARVQTVEEGTNPLLYQLLSKYKELTAHGILLNTSFNERGEPMVCSPQDAYACFMRTEIDILAMDNFIFEKDKQLVNAERWKRNFEKD